MWRIVTGALVLSAGLLITGIGVHGMTLPGKCEGTDRLPDPEMPCPVIYSEAVRGSAGSVLGVGLIFDGIGIGLLAWPGPRVDVFGPAARTP